MIMSFWVKTSSQFSSISSNPLVSSIVALYALILLYLPSHFTTIVFSPVLIITATLLLSLLRFGATQTQRSSPDESSSEKPTDRAAAEEDHGQIEWVDLVYRSETETDSDSEPETGFETGFEAGPSFEDSFVQWNLRAPLEVIYEDHEEEEEEEEEDDKIALSDERYQSLSRFYPGSDSDDSSDGGFSATGFWDSPDNQRFKWDEEDDRDEGLIEIALDRNDMKSDYNNDKRRGLDFHVDEDNLIEIDISPARNEESPASIG